MNLCCFSYLAESVVKNGASVVGLAVSSAVNSAVYGVVNLSGSLGNGLEALKNVVSSASQASL